MATNFREKIVEEIAAIRANAEAEATKIRTEAETRAQTYEARLAALPAEVHNLSVEAWDKLVAFFAKV